MACGSVVERGEDSAVGRMGLTSSFPARVGAVWMVLAVAAVAAGLLGWRLCTSSESELASPSAVDLGGVGRRQACCVVVSCRRVARSFNTSY